MFVKLAPTIHLYQASIHDNIPPYALYVTFAPDKYEGHFTPFALSSLKVYSFE